MKENKTGLKILKILLWVSLGNLLVLSACFMIRNEMGRKIELAAKQLEELETVSENPIQAAADNDYAGMGESSWMNGENGNEIKGEDSRMPETDTGGTQKKETGQAEEAAIELPEITLIMVGDMLMHLRVTQSGRMEDGTYNYDHIFENVKEDIERADLALVNEEVIIGGEELGFSGYPLFNTSYALADAIWEAGFDVILHATNHSMDKGKKGLENDLRNWKEKYPELAIIGMYETQEESNEIYVYEKDGIKIAILNYTYGLNGMPMPSDMPFAVNLMDKEKMAEDIAKAKEKADFVVVCPHWGIEYRTKESQDQREWCEFLLEQGVNLVIGTHPHVIEPVEMWEDEAGNQMLVYYSLGNYINSTADSGTGIGKRVVGAMAQVRIGRDEEDQVYIKEYDVEPLVTQIAAGPGGITTYRLKDYTKELAKENQMSRKDSGFSLEMCQKLCEEVFGELYTDGADFTY